MTHTAYVDFVGNFNHEHYWIIDSAVQIALLLVRMTQASSYVVDMETNKMLPRGHGYSYVTAS